MKSNPRVSFTLATRRPAIAAPGGKPLICHIVVNIEHWPFDQPMNRQLFPKPQSGGRGPDIANFCWVESGLRAGIPRLLRVCSERRLPVTAAMNSSVIDVYPEVAQAVRAAGWRFMGHGVVQRSLESEADEAAVIRTALDRVEAFAAYRPRSWLGPGLGETFETPDHLVAAGIRYIFDWCLDDLPDRMRTRSGTPAYAMPYALELNDVTIFGIERHESRVYYERFRDAVEVLAAEAHAQPRVLTLALHPHIIAQPHRLPDLCRTLDLLQRRSDTVFMTCDEIGDWYHEAVGQYERTGS